MGLQGCSTCCQLSACANHEGDEAKAGGAQEFKEWATLKRQLTPPVGPLSCCAQGLGRSGRDHLKLLGLADLSMQVMWPKRKAVPSSCWPGSWKEQVKSCTVHPAAGSTQKRGSGVGHQIKVFAFITSPPYRFRPSQTSCCWGLLTPTTGFCWDSWGNFQPVFPLHLYTVGDIGAETMATDLHWPPKLTQVWHAFLAWKK